MTLVDPESSPGFTFRCRNHVVRARLRPGHLWLNTTLGRVPSTAEATTEVSRANRTRSLVATRALSTMMPPEWQLWLLADHSVQLQAEARLNDPLTLDCLLAQLTGFSLSLTPYLDLIEGEVVLSAA